MLQYQSIAPIRRAADRVVAVLAAEPAPGEFVFDFGKQLTSAFVARTKVREFCVESCARLFLLRLLQPHPRCEGSSQPGIFASGVPGAAKRYASWRVRYLRRASSAAGWM